MPWRGEQPVVTRAPNQAEGYYAGSPLFGGSGSGKGQAVAGTGQLAPGQTVTVGGTEWHPTVLYLGALIIVEMVAFGFIARLLAEA